MNKKKERPLFDLSQTIIIERVAVTFLKNINNKGIIIKAGELRKAKLHIDNSTGERVLYINFGEKGTMKVPMEEIVHEKYGQLIKVHLCGSKEANLIWGIKESE